MADATNAIDRLKAMKAAKHRKEFDRFALGAMKAIVQAKIKLMDRKENEVEFSPANIADYACQIANEMMKEKEKYNG